MRITDIISITELAKLLKKSRPTVYKYISDFECKNYAAVPHSVKKLFQKIQAGDIPKREIYQYCDYWFADAPLKGELSKIEDKPTTLKEIFKLLKEQEKNLDLAKVKNYIEEELRK